MGIRGLLTYIRNSRFGRHPPLVLSSDTKRKYGTSEAVLVCDLKAIVFWLTELVLTEQSRDDKYVALYGVDFSEVRKKLMGLIEALRHIDIEPVFFWDGPRGSRSCSAQDLDLDVEKWKKSTMSLFEAIDYHARIANYEAPDVKFDNRINRPSLVLELMIALTKDVEVELITCTDEYDTVMAHYMRTHPNVCGILTRDTDLMLMAGCSAIHYTFFDLEKTLKLAEPEMNKQPFEIHCHAIGPECLAKHLGISEECLPALSIICGNGITKSLNEEIGIMEVFGFPHVRHKYFESAIAWIKRHMDPCKSANSFLKIREVERICQTCPQYRSAIVDTYSFYDAQWRPDASHSLSPLCAYITSEVEQHKINSVSLPIVKNGILWRSSIEQLDDKLPCIHETLLPIRRIMYQLLCCPVVREYGQSKMKDLVCDKKVDITAPFVLEDLKKLREAPLPQVKLAILHHILKTHELTKDVSSLLAIPPMECPIEDLGPLITCMSFMYFHRRGLIPSEDYITPLLLACFHCSLGLSPPRLSARPGRTGITIASQFMMVLQHIQWILSLLGINDEFPLPSTIFQPYVYIPLHGTAFKLSRKEKFHGNDDLAEEHFVSLSANRVFNDFKRCICDGRDIDDVGTMVHKYKKTRDELWQEINKKQPQPIQKGKK